MKNRLGFGFLIVAIAGLFSCTVDKKVLERLDKIEARLDAIEKMLRPPEEEVQKEAFNIPIGNSNILVAPDAKTSDKAHIVVFSNFQCPYCSRADNALRDLLKDPELKDRIDIVFKHFPFPQHPMARPASKAAIAAGEQGNDKFWAMTKKLFDNQSQLSEANFPIWAKEIGLNVEKFTKDLKDNNEKYDAIIDEDIQIGSKNAKLEGTPWVVVDGWLLKKGISAAAIKEQLDSQAKGKEKEKEKEKDQI